MRLTGLTISIICNSGNKTVAEWFLIIGGVKITNLFFYVIDFESDRILSMSVFECFDVGLLTNSGL